MRLLENIHQADLCAFSWLLRHRHRATIVSISRFISHSADGQLYIVAALVCAYLKQWPLLSLMAICFFTERVCYKISKQYFKRNRPPEAIPGFKSVVIPSDQFSFPSGHTSAAFVFACIFTFFYPSLAVVLYFWALAVGVSRVVLGVHFPSDIIAGAFLGSSIFAFYLQTFI